MTSQKRPTSQSLEETYFDDPPDDAGYEWEEITQDPVKRVAFVRRCIEVELTDEKRVIILQDNPSTRSHCCFWECIPYKLNGEPNIRSAFRFNVKDLSGSLEPNKYYHVTCMEQIFPDLAALIDRGVFWKITCFHDAIEIWKYAKWDRDSSAAEINHQLEAHGGSSWNCERCGNIPDELLRKDYFPEEPRSCLLSQFLASVIDVQHLDGVDGNSKPRHVKKARRS
ncbi:hypothetical protein BJX64DRAFT_281593 [Aspergillus heterothallicus]